MNEDIYRGRDYTGKWHTGSAVIFGPDCVFIVPPYPQASTMSPAQIFALTAVRVDPETLGQSTGQSDKKNSLIFDGDILRFDLPEEDGTISKSYYQVYWADGAWRTQHKQTVPELFTRLDAIQMELAGNIYDNPELLGE